MDIKITPLGAGQDVGRSCILVSIGGKNIMFDCGMHMGFTDHRRFPNFSYISKTGKFDQVLDLVIISHFHLDHCGSLPHFTEQLGYSGPIIMTYPTKAICPVLLEDFRKITVERLGEKNFFTSDQIKACMQKVTGVNLHETVELPGMSIKCYYAGHVIGAAMFRVQVGAHSVVYTGDYNMTADRHLGSAWIDRCQPDVLITETTYATYTRDSKKLREQNFLQRIKDCVTKGGKVLVPVFALGRAQELCILLDAFWTRQNLSHIPIYFAAGLTAKATLYYKLFLNWTNQKIKQTFIQEQHNMFDFKNISQFDKSYITSSGPMVVFATPGMLHAGLALDIFKVWCSDEKNLVILPGYCVAGTVGNQILSGQKTIVIDKTCTVEVKCGVANLSFSAHADAKGILQLITQAAPRNVVLVHGEKEKMKILSERIQLEHSIPTFYPANGATLNVKARADVPIRLLSELVAQDQGADTPIVGVLVQAEDQLSLVKDVKPSLPSHTLVFSSKHLFPLIPLDVLCRALSCAFPAETVTAVAEKQEVCLRSAHLHFEHKGGSVNLLLRANFEDEHLYEQICKLLATPSFLELANTSGLDVVDEHDLKRERQDDNDYRNVRIKLEA